MTWIIVDTHGASRLQFSTKKKFCAWVLEQSRTDLPHLEELFVEHYGADGKRIGDMQWADDFL